MPGEKMQLSDLNKIQCILTKEFRKTEKALISFEPKYLIEELELNKEFEFTSDEFVIKIIKTNSNKKAGS